MSIKKLPKSAWIGILLLANVITCVALYQTCDTASGRSVDDSLFRPKDDSPEEEEFFEANYEREETTAPAAIDSTADEPIFDEMLDNGADPLHTDDMTDPNMYEEETLDPSTYDGVEADENVSF